MLRSCSKFQDCSPTDTVTRLSGLEFVNPVSPPDLARGNGRTSQVPEESSCVDAVLSDHGRTDPSGLTT